MLAGFRGGRPAESGWCAQLSGVAGDILALISCSWLLDEDCHSWQSVALFSLIHRLDLGADVCVLRRASLIIPVPCGESLEPS